MWISILAEAPLSKKEKILWADFCNESANGPVIAKICSQYYKNGFEGTLHILVNNRVFFFFYIGRDESNPVYTGSVHCHISVTGYWTVLGMTVFHNINSGLELIRYPLRSSYVFLKEWERPQTKPSIKDNDWKNKPHLHKWLMHKLRLSSPLIPVSLFLLFKQEIFMASSHTKPAGHAVSLHKVSAKWHFKACLCLTVVNLYLRRCWNMKRIIVLHLLTLIPCPISQNH